MRSPQLRRERGLVPQVAKEQGRLVSKNASCEQLGFVIRTLGGAPGLLTVHDTRHDCARSREGGELAIESVKKAQEMEP